MTFMTNLSRKTLTLIGGICLFGFAACQDDIPSSESTPFSSNFEIANSGTPIPFGLTYSLVSKTYGSEREINVYVPEIPEWGKGYFQDPLPVLYVVDGGTDQDFFHIAALSQLTLINAERQPMIVVGVRTYDRRPEISPQATDPRYLAGDFKDWGGSHDFRRHLLEEVKPFIEERYKTGRSAVIGESLAGLFITEMFLEKPGSFDDYISISPSLWWDDRRLSKTAVSLLENHKPSDKRLYFTMANEGGTMRLGLDELLQTLGAYKDVVDVKFVDRADIDTHASIYHHAARDALTWMYGIPAEPYGEAPWYLTIDGMPSELKTMK